MPCPFTGLKMFCASPNFLSQPKNLTAFSASSKTFVPAQKTILLTANHLFVWHKMFVSATICKCIFGLAQKFGPAQNISGPEKDKALLSYLIYILCLQVLLSQFLWSCLLPTYSIMVIMSTYKMFTKNCWQFLCTKLVFQYFIWASELIFEYSCGGLFEYSINILNCIFCKFNLCISIHIIEKW